MAEQHYFLFSTGDYDDYVVTGLYCCDHEVNLEEWQEFKENYERIAILPTESVLAWDTKRLR